MTLGGVILVGHLYDGAGKRGLVFIHNPNFPARRRKIREWHKQKGDKKYANPKPISRTPGWLLGHAATLHANGVSFQHASLTLRSLANYGFMGVNE
jgi:hypothetical protein